MDCSLVFTKRQTLFIEIFLLLFGNKFYCFRRPGYGLKLTVLGEYGECFDDYFNGGCLK